MNTRTTYLPFQGGLDQVSAPYSMPDGSAIEAENFEIGPLGGYARIPGFERFDGQPEPHKAAPTGGSTPREVAQSQLDAANARRALITAVPGSGPIRGVVAFNEVVYAFRDNAAGTACAMYRSSPTGWQLVTTPTLQPGGACRFAIWNFGGAVFKRTLYGCDGVNKAFFFDGTTFTQITTGMAPDAPGCIAAHKNHLFLAFGASLQHSAIADPTSWTPVLGAGEIALGDDITNLAVTPGGSGNATLLATTRSSVRILYGNSAADWQLVTLSDETGAYRGSVTQMGANFALSRRGVIALQADNTFANFNVSALSARVAKFVEARAPQVRGVTTSFARNQVTWHFGAGVALTTTVGPNGVMGFLPLSYGVPFSTFWSASRIDGSDLVLAGGEDGFVYSLNVGTSFDGAPIPARLWLNYSSIRSPRNRKRFRKAVIEATADSFASFQTRASFSFGDSAIVPFDDHGAELRPSYSAWDTALWDVFFFDGRPIEPIEIKLEGSGETVSLMFASNTNLASRFTLHGAIVHFDLRRLAR